MSGVGVSVQAAMQRALEYQQAGRFDLAEAVYSQVLRVLPNHHEVLRLSGIVAHRLGNGVVAVDRLKRSIAARPAGDTYTTLGIVLADTGRQDEAVATFKIALHLEPDNVRVLTRLGVALKVMDRHVEAIEYFARLAVLAPDAFDSHAHYGQSLRALGRLDAAIARYRRALELVPDHAAVWGNLGMAQLDCGDLAGALASLRHSLTLDPAAAHIHSNLLFALMFDVACSPAQYLAEAKKFGAAVSVRARPHACWRTEPAGSAVSRLRVGVVSGDLRQHAVSRFFEGVITASKSGRVEWIAYVTKPGADEVTARIRPHFAEWNDISGIADEAAAKKIHDDRIHVLVDLAGHTAHNRLPMFAWKPAPVQVSWLGYAASTGVPAMDWLLTDAVSVPQQESEHYTERLWHMPDTRLCFTPPGDTALPPVSGLPALVNGHITFGSFQRISKLDDAVLVLWAGILGSVPQSRLRIQNAETNVPSARENFLRRMKDLGIPSERIRFAEKMSYADYLAAHAEVDIILDTFPYPGGTTTCEALLMGVPTLTLQGHTFLARQGASLLSAAGLPDWIAHDEKEYLQKAVAHAADPAALARLRATLRNQVVLSPLFDGKLFARRLEDALHGIWRATAPAD